jgi:hypothetical protein
MGVDGHLTHKLFAVAVKRFAREKILKRNARQLRRHESERARFELAPVASASPAGRCERFAAGSQIISLCLIKGT